MQGEKLTLTEHLEELRARVIKSVIFLVICLVVVFNYVDKLIPFLIRPIGKLVFIAPQEAFVANIKIAFFGSLFLASPFILYQVWKFISTGLESSEKKYSLIFGPLSFLFFIVGISFGYFVIVPIGLKFLLGFASDFLSPMITISGYISFVGTLALTFGVVFQLPLLSAFLTKISIVTPKFLSSNRKHAIVIIFVVAAFLTPPDVVTQVLMALPLIFLYELGIIFSRIAYRKHG